MYGEWMCEEMITVLHTHTYTNTMDPKSNFNSPNKKINADTTIYVKFKTTELAEAESRNIVIRACGNSVFEFH